MEILIGRVGLLENSVPEERGSSRAPLPFPPSALARHRELVTRMAAGDGEALQLLYLELGATVHGVVRRILENHEDAREVVQDAFVKAWRNARAFDAERGEVIAWLVFIARHAAIDRVRKGARQRLLHAALEREARDGAAATPPAGDFDQRAELARHLAQLSPAQRRALELAFFNGCTQAQIAAALQTPIGNVKNHLRRGLQKLRQIVIRP